MDTVDPIFSNSPIDVAFYDSSNIYWAFVASSLGQTLLHLVKFTDAGTRVWYRQIGNATLPTQRGYSLAVGEPGYVYIAGKTQVSGQGTKDNLLLYKYNSAGTMQWMRLIGGANSVIGCGAVVDPAGGVLVAGTTWNNGAGDADMLLVRYNAVGQMQWNRTWGGTGSENGNGIALDANGNVYVTGSTTSFGAGLIDMAVVKYANLNVPAAPGGIQATPGTGHVNVTWSAPADGGSPITGYSLYWSTDNATFARIDLGNVLAYQHGSLMNGQRYYYKVAAVNVVGRGSNSTTVSATPGLPARVQNVAANPGDGHVNLTWTALGDGGSPITGYSLYWSTDNATFARIDLGNVLAYQHGGLNVGQAYYYKVAAVNANGEGTNSSVVRATTWDTPAQVTGLAVIPGAGHVNLTWTAPRDGGSPITGYSLYWSTDNVAFGRIDLGNVLAYQHSGLNVGQAYYYKVSAVNIVDEGQNSTVASTTTNDVPTRVIGLAVAPGEGHMNLTWTAPGDGGSPITGYSLYWSTDNASFARIDLGNVLAYQHGGLNVGQAYYYKVAAVNAVGHGPNSSVVSATACGAPAQVTGLGAIPGNQQVNLTWTAPGDGGSPITGYSLYWSTDNASFARIDLGNVLAYQHGGLNVGQAYYYKVAAVNAVGHGPNSSVVITTTLNVPAQITGLITTPGNCHVNLTWNAPGDGGSPITGYSLYWSTDNVAFGRIDLGNVLAYLHSGLNVDQAYYYKISAVNAVGQGPNSSVVITMTWDTPAQVTGLVATSGNRKVTLNWTAPLDGGSPLIGYNIYRAPSISGEYSLAGTSIDPSYKDMCLAPGTTYYYKVAAVNALGEGVNSSTVSCTTRMPPGVPSVTIITVSPTTNRVISLTWSPVPGAETYIVYRHSQPTTSANVQSALVVMNSSATMVNDTVPGTGTYWYSVVAVNASGASALSTSIKVIVVAPPGRDWVIIIVIAAGAVVGVGMSAIGVKRRVRVRGRAAGKAKKASGYVLLPGKKTSVGKYTSMEEHSLPDTNPQDKHPVEISNDGKQGPLGARRANNAPGTGNDANARDDGKSG